MSETQRTDPHSTGAIISSDYDFVLWYEMGGASEPPVNTDCTRPTYDFTSYKVIPAPGHVEGSTTCCLRRLRESGAKFAEHGGGGSCTICGSGFRYGEVWRHRPTTEHIHVGHVCADKWDLTADRSEAIAHQARLAELRSKAGREKKLATARDAWLAVNPDVAEAFKLAEAFVAPETVVFGDRRPEGASILRDMARRLHQYGSLSEKQIAFALKLKAQLEAPAPVAERHVPAPEGRQVVTGRVVSVRDQESDYGLTWKMTVKVETPDGSWLTWSTVPAAIHDVFLNTEDANDGLASWLKGRTVTFTATLSRGNDEHFAFAKRPSKATVAPATATE
jgi:hypothetical protein